MTIQNQEGYLSVLYEMTEANDPDNGNMLAIGEKLGYDASMVEVVTHRLEQLRDVGRGLGFSIHITQNARLRVKMMRFLKGIK